MIWRDLDFDSYDKQCHTYHFLIAFFLYIFSVAKLLIHPHSKKKKRETTLFYFGVSDRRWCRESWSTHIACWNNHAHAHRKDTLSCVCDRKEKRLHVWVELWRIITGTKSPAFITVCLIRRLISSTPCLPHLHYITSSLRVLPNIYSPSFRM